MPTNNNFAFFAPLRPLRDELGINCAAGAGEGLSLQRLCVLCERSSPISRAAGARAVLVMLEGQIPKSGDS